VPSESKQIGCGFIALVVGVTFDIWGLNILSYSDTVRVEFVVYLVHQ